MESETMFESQIVGWCDEARVWDEYRGAGTPCPMEFCLEGERNHYLRRRRMYVCSVCSKATPHKPSDCDHLI